jgi:hypothetical protein
LSPTPSWIAVPEERSLCAKITHQDQNPVVIFSPVHYLRGKARRLGLCPLIENGLMAIEANAGGQACRPGQDRCRGPPRRPLLPSPARLRHDDREALLLRDFHEGAQRHDVELVCAGSSSRFAFRALGSTGAALLSDMSLLYR